MLIGFDFDNTIVNYDTIFYKVGLEQGVIPAGIATNKLAVNQYLLSNGMEHVWRQLQGVVYGARIEEAEPFPGVIEVMRYLKQAGHTLAIVSHKSIYSHVGEPYNLHNAARSWVEKNLWKDGEILVSPDQIYFEVTKGKKIDRIKVLSCDVFLDDLPEILQGLPSSIKQYLFDPTFSHASFPFDQIEKVSTWKEFESHLTKIHIFEKESIEQEHSDTLLLAMDALPHLGTFFNKRSLFKEEGQLPEFNPQPSN